MKLFLVAFTLLLVGLASSYPYQTEDGDEEIIEFIPMRRVPRGIPQYRAMRGQQPQFQPSPYAGRQKLVLYKPQNEEPMMSSSSRKEPLVAAETGYGHSSHPYDYVDYGAYTGGYGAFGWYTDHPVHVYGHGGY